MVVVIHSCHLAYPPLIGPCLVQSGGAVLSRRLGGFEEFRSRFPEWCESYHPAEPPIVGLKSLRITCLEADETGVDGACDSSLGRDTPLDDLGFPVEILPHLYLGNAQNSGDRDALNRHKIQYIINVTPNLPNVFDKCGSFKYMKIPIADHWSQNLASFFPKAIQFIVAAVEFGILYELQESLFASLRADSFSGLASSSPSAQSVDAYMD
ncbi:Dual specificity protein phosphatase 7 [Chionoecetes opilio]|uniref:protein-tyrosine-phosphatase n=1 Tax=Chionoecetes opilio TaxID=41210 RepID=A0A8J5D3X7_CHIOP|nr:Dual specificity protein phosphatase 7 [Chionoecetes opilio]